MTPGTDLFEERRLELQRELDGIKTQAERNKLGQFATPTGLAREILAYGVSLLPQGERIRFLDPAVGTGSFYSALLSQVQRDRIDSAVGFEVDPHYGLPAAEMWNDACLEYRHEDFTRAVPAPSANLLICNPPYVRHHHLDADDKGRLQLASSKAFGGKISGLAGLYCYFLAIADGWMADGGVAAWLIPSEFMDVNYGRAVKRYLLDGVTLLHIHRFDPNEVQFADALVSSAIVFFRKASPPPAHEVEFSYGGTLREPHDVRHVSIEALRSEPKWTRFPASAERTRFDGPVVSDFFRIKRGIATGDNGYFILSEDEIAARELPRKLFKPILPSPRYMPQDVVEADERGEPILPKRLFLFDTKLSEPEINERYPALAAYLAEGRERGLNERYLCRTRKPWYSQENRPAAPIVCTYLGRGDSKSGRPFRFIRNRSSATIANVYLAMYPTEAFARAIEADPNLMDVAWQALNRITPEQLLGEGRVYGGGLHKLEPKELANVPVPELAGALPEAARTAKQQSLFSDVVAAE